MLLHKYAIKTVVKNCAALLSLSKTRWNAASKRIKVKKIVRLFKHKAGHVLLEKHSSKCGGYNIFLNVCHNHYFSSWCWCAFSPLDVTNFRSLVKINERTGMMVKVNLGKKKRSQLDKSSSLVLIQPKSRYYLFRDSLSIAWCLLFLEGLDHFLCSRTVRGR